MHEKEKGRQLVVGDIHGNIEALREVFLECSLDYDDDLLIILGDVVDGWPGIDTKSCIELLLKVKNRIFVLGNHDRWFLQFIEDGYVEPGWYGQGGEETLKSYGIEAVGYDEFVPDVPIIKIDDREKKIPQTHISFLQNHVYYHIDEKNRMFVHGGFKPGVPLDEQKYILLWDRDLINLACHGPIGSYGHIFVGHTTTQRAGNDPSVKDCLVPMRFNNLTMMDTGAGSRGRLTIMDVDTREFWQSEAVSRNE